MGDPISLLAERLRRLERERLAVLRRLDLEAAVGIIRRKAELAGLLMPMGISTENQLCGPDSGNSAMAENAD